MTTTKSETPWRDAILAVLKSAGTALHYSEIAEQIEKQNLRRKLGATPANTVSSHISTSIRNEGDDSPFIKTERGKYMLRSERGEIKSIRIADDIEEPLDEAAVVKVVGMYWNADRVEWKRTPRLLGQQQSGSKPVDFSAQIGIYILYDQNRVLYVGRAADGRLGQRLSEHRRDRLNGRWNRFSWFGLRGVDDNGQLTDASQVATQMQILSLMEAVLIEALEPPQNRKRGDDFSGIEYLQAEDPAITKKNKEILLKEMLSKLEG